MLAFQITTPLLSASCGLCTLSSIFGSLSTKENVIAVHCLAGKGRTGMTIICTLIMQGFFNHVMRKSFSSVINAAINYFHDKRGDGVENPDQIRFIYQFLQSMNTMGSDMLMQIGEEMQPTVFLPP